ncbi:MAG: endospore germination permease [Alicyclobacillus sp.]|nr:endospore germination permease [Alicyclobacillus sp.]
MQHRVPGLPAKVSNRQILTYITLVTIAYGHFVTIGLVFRAAGRDAWVATSLGCLLGGGVVWVQFCVWQAARGRSLMAACTEALGRWLGALISAVYGLLFVCLAAFTLREQALFLGLIYPTTPPLVFMFFLLWGSVWVVRSGMEVAGRMAQLCLPFLVLLGLLASLATLPDKDFLRLLPVLDHSSMQLLHATLLVVSLFCDWVVVGALSDGVDQPQLLPRQAFWVSCLLVLAFLGPATGPVLVFGEPLAQSLAYPTYSEIQFIRLTGVVERLDVIGVLLWTIGSFLRLVLYLLAVTRVLHHVTGGPRSQLWAVPAAWLTAGCAISLLPLSREDLHTLLYQMYPLCALVLGLGLPALLWVAIRVRATRRPQQQAAA